MKHEQINTELDRLILIANKLKEDVLSGQARGQKVPPISPDEYVDLLTSAMTIADFIEAHVHFRLCESLLEALGTGKWSQPGMILGLLQSLKSQLSSGFFQHGRTLATAAAMNDVLEQAGSLLENDYKDASCVLIGGALETVFNKMLEDDHYDGDVRKVMLKQKNDMLLKRDKYDKVTHGQIVAWADLRNDAAHGNYAVVKKEQVADFLKFTRDFIMRWYTPKITK